MERKRQNKTKNNQNMVILSWNKSNGEALTKKNQITQIIEKYKPHIVFIN